MINKEAGALYRAVYDDPSILDSSKSDDERARLLQPHAEALTAELVSEGLNRFGYASDASELNEDDLKIFDRMATTIRGGQGDLKQRDLQALADPEVRQALQRVLVEGKNAGLSLDALLQLPRGTNHRLVSSMAMVDSLRIVDQLINREKLTGNELLRAEILFGKLDVPREPDPREA